MVFLNVIKMYINLHVFQWQDKGKTQQSPVPVLHSTSNPLITPPLLHLPSPFFLDEGEHRSKAESSEFCQGQKGNSKKNPSKGKNILSGKIKRNFDFVKKSCFSSFVLSFSCFFGPKLVKSQNSFWNILIPISFVCSSTALVYLYRT